jgi:hypothetical protein
MFPGINKKEQDRVRARFSMDVTKRCSAEIKQAHKQFAGHMTKIIRKLRYTSDNIVACVIGQCGQLCKKHSLVCSGGRKAVWHHSFACVHHRESGLEVFAAKFQTLGLS